MNPGYTVEYPGADIPPVEHVRVDNPHIDVYIQVVTISLVCVGFPSGKQ